MPPLKREASAIQMGQSIGIVLPHDWVAGNQVRRGDRVRIEYDSGEIRVLPPTRLRNP